MEDADDASWLDGPVLLTGASGFVGRHLYPRLVEEGLPVRCGSRRPDQMAREYPEREWVAFDLDDEATLRESLEGVDAAFYLVHRMHEGGDYRARERASAVRFAEAAEEAGVRRIVYLGGIAPDGEPSEHLASRLETGRMLRRSSVSTIELRAAMIIGPGSASWQICRDLAARLPAMLLPKWTESRSEPLYVDDLVDALVAALHRPLDQNTWHDIPGPEVLSVRNILRRTAKMLGHEPREMGVPLLTPRLSSYWLKFVTRADLTVARELVEGLKTDILARNDQYWEMIGHDGRVGFDDAVARTIAADETPSLPARMYEGIVRRFAGRSSGSRE